MGVELYEMFEDLSSGRQWRTTDGVFFLPLPNHDKNRLVEVLVSIKKKDLLGVRVFRVPFFCLLHGKYFQWLE